MPSTEDNRKAYEFQLNLGNYVCVFHINIVIFLPPSFTVQIKSIIANMQNWVDKCPYIANPPINYE